MTVTDLPVRKTDQEKAEDYRRRMLEALEPIRQLLDEAKSDGMLLEFQMGMDMYGRSTVLSTGVVRRLL